MDELPIDRKAIPPIPVSKTIVLINNFVVNTTRFINHFSELCEDKISNVSSKVTELEILVSTLEVKLNSIPGLEAAPNIDSETLPDHAGAPAPAPSAAARRGASRSAANLARSPTPSSR